MRTRPPRSCTRACWRWLTSWGSACDERAARILESGLRVTLCGRPNVGKSSLLNALLGEERAIVTSVAGTTRDVITGELQLDGLLVKFYDTAGLHEAGDQVERDRHERVRKRPCGRRTWCC